MSDASESRYEDTPDFVGRVANLDYFEAMDEILKRIQILLSDIDDQDVADFWSVVEMIEKVRAEIRFPNGQSQMELRRRLIVAQLLAIASTWSTDDVQRYYYEIRKEIDSLGLADTLNAFAVQARQDFSDAA